MDSTKINLILKSTNTILDVDAGSLHADTINYLERGHTKYYDTNRLNPQDVVDISSAQIDPALREQILTIKQEVKSLATLAKGHNSTLIRLIR